MKNILFVLATAVLIFSCNPKEKKPGTVLVIPAGDTTKIIEGTFIEDRTPPLLTNAKVKPDHPNKVERISCSFGIKKFNQRRRPIEEAPGGVKGKPPKHGTGGGGGGDTTYVPPISNGEANLIYINFFGKDVSGTMWNTNGDIIVGDAGLAQIEIDSVTARVKRHFLDFNIGITYNKFTFDSMPAGHKVEIIVTEDWQWYGQAGGVSYLGSWYWVNTPSFVFSSLLNYSVHNIAEAIAHEAEHTINLRHQVTCSNDVITSQYNWGEYIDGIFVAPTMGASYNVDLGILYHHGPTPLGCGTTQDDYAMTATAFGLRQITMILPKNKRL